MPSRVQLPDLKIKPDLKPDWFKVKAPGGENFVQIKDLFKKLKLNTVCEEARCPNMAECWGGGTATLMLMGDSCTRACKFCHVKTGNPKGAIDVEEPEKVAKALGELGLTYVVLTSVTRDDLPDGGADHFSRTVEAIKQYSPETLVEVLIPDFRNNDRALDRMSRSGVDVLAHNIETVRRLSPTVRDKRADYDQSIEVLRKLKEKGITYTKSALMVGLGETSEEVFQAMDDLRAVGVDILTIGQYLRPTSWHLPVVEYVNPSTFKMYEEAGLKKGFLFVPSGPLVRSSYRAGEKFLESMLRGNQNGISQHT